MISQFVDRWMLSISLSLVLANSIISPGLAQVTGKNDCHRYDPQEATKLRSIDRRVTRQRTKLIIKTRQQLVVFRDICDKSQEMSTTYTLESYFPEIDYFLVRQSAYEEGDYTLVNGKTGAQTVLFTQPVFSPDRQHFASMTIDEMNGNTSVYIYRIDPTGVKVEYQDNDKKWRPTNPIWRNNTTIEFTNNPRSGKPVKVVLRRSGRDWVTNSPKVPPDTK